MLMCWFGHGQYAVSKTVFHNFVISSEGDRAEMAHSIEGRPPFLDHTLVEYVDSLPPYVSFLSSTVTKTHISDFPLLPLLLSLFCFAPPQISQSQTPSKSHRKSLSARFGPASEPKVVIHREMDPARSGAPVRD